MKSIKKILIILFVFPSLAYSQGVSVLEPSLGYRSWKGEESTHQGREFALKYISTTDSLMYGLNFRYNSFDENMDDTNLVNTKWEGLDLSVFGGMYFENFYISLGYVFYDKLSSDKTTQYINASTLVNLEDVSILGSGFDTTLGTRLSENVTLSFNYKNIKYHTQEQASASSTSIETNIQSFTILIGYLFKFGEI